MVPFVQQIGTAREIYEAPVNRFVADFIGETNLLEVTVGAVEKGMARVTLPGGHQISCAASAGTGAGQSHVSIRPERISLTKGDADLSAVVERVVYLGTDLQLLMRLDGGAALQLRLQNAARSVPPAAGARVGLHLEEGAARLLAD